jgi:hypothetical protein
MTARFMSIRPSLPHVQAERDQSIRQSRQRRAEAKLVKATASAPSSGTAENGMDDLVGFARWYASFQNTGLLAGLVGHEEARFRALAMEAFKRNANPARWASALAALRDRQKEAGAALEVAHWRQQSRHRWSTSHGEWV